MTIIKIQANDNGSHDNNTIYGATLEEFTIPEGWALLPESLGTPETLESFPFGIVTAEDIDGVPTVTSWTPGTVPEPEPTPDPEEEVTPEDVLKTMLGG